MLLSIYLVTTAISWSTSFILAGKCKRRLVTEGYQFIKTPFKQNAKQKTLNFISTVCRHSIPIINIRNTIGLLGLGDRLYDYYKQASLKQGLVYLPVKRATSSNAESFASGEITTYTKDIEQTVIEREHNETALDRKLSYSDCATFQPNDDTCKPIENDSMSSPDQKQSGHVLKKTLSIKHR